MDSTLYRQLLGSLMYMIHSRPKIYYATNILSQFMFDPKHKHGVTSKHVLRYLHGTVYYGIRYASNRGVLLLGYTDSDWGGNIIDQKRNSGYCYRLGSSMISWSSKKHV